MGIRFRGFVFYERDKLKPLGPIESMKLSTHGFERGNRRVRIDYIVIAGIKEIGGIDEDVEKCLEDRG